MDPNIATIGVAIIVSWLFLPPGTCPVGARAGVREANKMTVYRIGQLEAKVDKHNNLIERMTTVESGVTRTSDRLDSCQEICAQRRADMGKLNDARNASASASRPSVTEVNKHEMDNKAAEAPEWQDPTFFILMPLGA